MKHLRCQEVTFKRRSYMETRMDLIQTARIYKN